MLDDSFLSIEHFENLTAVLVSAQADEMALDTQPFGQKKVTFYSFCFTEMVKRLFNVP